MSFKDDVKTDLNEVFFDTEEFADVHAIDGIAVVAVVHEYSEKESADSSRTSNTKLNKKEHAIDEVYVHIHIKTSDYREKLGAVGRARLSANAMINVDGKNLFVKEYSENGGVIDIRCSRHQT